MEGPRMNRCGISGADRSNIIISDPYFHSRIIEKNSPGVKKFYSFPLLLFRKDSGEGFVWKNKLFFPIHFHFFRQIISQISPKTRMETENQLLQLAVRKKKGAHDVYEKVSNHPVIVDTVHKKIPGEIFLRNSIATPVARNSAFLSDRRSRKPINQVYPENKISGEFFKALFSAKEGIQGLNQASLKSAVPGKTLPDGKALFESSSALNPTSFAGLTVNLNSQPIVSPGPAFDSGPVLERSHGKELYPQASGKELVFNSAAGLTQGLEREVATIKEELYQAEKISQANYSSIYSKIEEELKQRFQIDRISEQVMQQIIWRLRIEKERRGLL